MPLAFFKMWVPEIQIHTQELFFNLLSHPQPLVVIKKKKPK